MDREPSEDGRDQGTHISVPGTTNDKMAMLLYHLPERIRLQATEGSSDCFLPLVQAMVDYSLFEHRIWQQVRVDGTLAEFLSTALYQIVRRVRHEYTITNEDYPTFELAWRRSIATRLKALLPIAPETVCPTIHQVIPVGVEELDAIKALAGAIPPDIQDPYTVTVQSSAVDDQCGSLAITQPMQYTVVHIKCILNPRLLVEVCRELRIGHKAVVNELLNLRKETTTTRTDTNRQLSIIRNENTGMKDQLSIIHKENNGMKEQLSTIQTEMKLLVTRLTEQDDHQDEPIICTKLGCSLLATERFPSGKRRKQCARCLSYANTGKVKRKTSG